MESFALEQTGAGLQVLGLPDAVRVIRLDGKIAVKMAHLTLHRSDLQLAKDSLEQINQNGNETVRRALWETAVLHLVKCFDTTSRRTALDAKRIYGSEFLATEAYRYFLSLRNKHLVHDENSYAQSVPCAAINDGSKSYKIEKILALSVRSETLVQENYSNLSKLVNDALAHVISKFGELCLKLTNELEALNFSQLSSFPDATFTAASLEELHDKRATPW